MVIKIFLSTQTSVTSWHICTVTKNYLKIILLLLLKWLWEEKYEKIINYNYIGTCLLYTSDAADE